MPDPMTTSEFLWILLGGLLLGVMILLGIVLHWRTWRRGADAIWSTRLEGLATALSGVTILSLFAVMLPELPPLWILAPTILAVATLMIWLAVAVARIVESERTRRERRAMGLEVPRRMVPPWVIGLGWFLLTLAAFLGVFAWFVLVTWPAITGDQLAFQDRIQPLWLTCGGVGVLCGGAHVLWQRRRRRQEHQRVAARNAARPVPEKVTHPDTTDEEEE